MVGAATVGATSLAFGAGVATFFSPCAYALLPGYVGYYVSAAEDEATGLLGGALARGLAACTGVAAVFAILSVAIVLVGRAFQPVIDVMEPLVGVALLGFGLALLLGEGPTLHVQLPERRSSVWGFAVFGAVYAIAGAGCVAPLFLAVVFKAVTLPASGALAVLAAYAVGFMALLLGATVTIAVGKDGLLDWLGSRRRLLDRAAAVALIAAGGWQVATTI